MTELARASVLRSLLAGPEGSGGGDHRSSVRFEARPASFPTKAIDSRLVSNDVYGMKKVSESGHGKVISNITASNTRENASRGVGVGEKVEGQMGGGKGVFSRQVLRDPVKTHSTSRRSRGSRNSRKGPKRLARNSKKREGGPPGVPAPPTSEGIDYERREKLWAASGDGDVVEMQKLIDDGIDVDGWDVEDCGPLYFACQRGHVDATRALIQAGADVNRRSGFSRFGATPVIIAAECGHIDVLKLLIEHGADVNLPRSKDGASALLMAVVCGREIIVEELLGAGAEVNQCADDDGSFPLYFAAQAGQLSLVKALLTAGADLELVCEASGCTSLFIAARQGRWRVVDALISAGAEVNSIRAGDAATPLWIACQRGKFEVAERLVVAGADVKGLGLLGIAQQRKDSMLRALLRAYGAD